jgi:hypothetical protein
MVKLCAVVDFDSISCSTRCVCSLSDRASGAKGTAPRFKRYLRGGRNEEAVMPLLFWYPIIVWSSMCSLALDSVTPRKTRPTHYI